MVKPPWKGYKGFATLCWSRVDESRGEREVSVFAVSVDQTVLAEEQL